MKLKGFKKYFAFTKGGILSTFAYKFSIYSWIIGDFVQIFIICSLWIAVYKFSPTAEINGYTMKDMLAYLVTARIVANLIMGYNSFWDISEDIREGTIAMNLIKPINYRLKMLFSCFGGFIGGFIVLFIPIYLIAIVVLNLTLGVDFPTWYNILFFLVSCTFGILIYDGFNVLIGQIAFYTGALFGVGLMKDAILGFLSGTMIPLAFFPEWGQSLLKFLPFSSLLSIPNQILLGAYSINETLINILVQLFWAILINILATLSYNRSMKHIISVGG